MDDRDLFEVNEFRKAKDLFFRTSPNSPLTSIQRESFTGLSYFDYNQALAFDLELEPCPPEEVLIRTSSGERKTYLRAGPLRFEIDGETQQLTALGRDGDDELFIPFADETSGHETYAGGRYLEVTRSEEGSLRLDFNYAYNPYCAYSSAWSCPLPPPENRLAVEIRAGERAFHSDH